MSQPVLLVVAAFSRHEAALTWGLKALRDTFGATGPASPVFAFRHTNYYEPAMGADLLKQLWTFRDLVAADRLAEIKQRTIELERRATGPPFAEPRPLNLDPGFLSLGKFVLATTKDQSHRIYLRDGIFAEVTLRFRKRAWEPWPWTYADYREPLVLDFLGEARRFYHQQMRAGDP